MNVTLELDGLAPKTSTQSTKAVTNYTHTVTGTGEQTITLVTTESTTSTRTCTVQLKAAGFEDSEVVSVKQANGIFLENKTIILNLKLNHSKPNDYTVDPDVNTNDGSSVEFDFNQTDDSSYTGSQPYTFTINLRNFTLSNAKEETEITFSCAMSRSSTYTFTKKITVAELITRFNNGSSATIDLGQK